MDRVYPPPPESLNQILMGKQWAKTDQIIQINNDIKSSKSRQNKEGLKVKARVEWHQITKSRIVVCLSSNVRFWVVCPDTIGSTKIENEMNAFALLEDLSLAKGLKIKDVASEQPNETIKLFTGKLIPERLGYWTNESRIVAFMAQKQKTGMHGDFILCFFNSDTN